MEKEEGCEELTGRRESRGGAAGEDPEDPGDPQEECRAPHPRAQDGVRNLSRAFRAPPLLHHSGRGSSLFTTRGSSRATGAKRGARRASQTRARARRELLQRGAPAAPCTSARDKKPRDPTRAPSTRHNSSHDVRVSVRGAEVPELLPHQPPQHSLPPHGPYKGRRNSAPPSPTHSGTVH